VTTIDAAAACRTSKLITFAVFATIVGISLGGCGTTTSLFSSNSAGQGTSLSAQSTTATPSAKQVNTISSAKVAIAPVIGAPDVIAKHLRSELSQALSKKSISVAANVGDTAAYTLRGYVVSAREKAKTKISYIWDVTDTSGKRVNRITGEEVSSTSSGSDPWAAMTPQIVEAISSKTASSLAKWLPTQTKTSAASAAIASSRTGTSPAKTAQAGTIVPAAGKTALATSTGTTTGSINKAGTVSAIIPNVTGAPGDGGVSLTNAIRKQLKAKGVAMANVANGTTYQVVGRVKVGQGKSGKQPIQIDWDVHDPSGKKLGTVSQKNLIPQGSLDGAWGKTADAAAAAATQGILRLLPKKTRTN